MSTKTQENLMASFAGESQANRKYLAFAQKAEKEGKENIAKLFRTVAEAETIHALKHFETAGQVGSTLDNLKGAIAGETHEFTEMYPGFIEEAKQEDHKAAGRTFNLANEAEKVHGELFKKALAALESGQDLQVGTFYLCPVCGYVEFDNAPEKCPICGAPSKSFKTL